MPTKPTHLAHYKESQCPYLVAKWGPRLVVVFHAPDPWGQSSASVTSRTHWTLLGRIEDENPTTTWALSA